MNGVDPIGVSRDAASEGMNAWESNLLIEAL